MSRANVPLNPETPNEVAQNPQVADASERAARFRILTVNGKRRAFALEPIFWDILEEAAEAESLRVGEYVSRLLENASRTNHSAFLRVKAAEWVERRREQFRDKDLLAVGHRIAASHSGPCFVIDQLGLIAAHNKAFSDLLRSEAKPLNEPEKLNVQLRLGITVTDMMRLLKENPEKFMRVRFSLHFSGYERPGVLNAMFVGSDGDARFALGLVQSIGEAIPRREDSFIVSRKQ